MRVEAEVHAAALLAHGREAGTVRMEPLEPPEHGRLGSGVDLERAVAALPSGARLTRALRGGRRGGENAAQLLGGSARGGRPIRCEGAHAPYPTKVPVIEESTVQLEAVTHPGGPLLILAAAGTGKTHTLIERFAWLVEQGTPADAILALTFATHRGRRPARAHRAARAGALRGAVDHDVPRLLRAAAPRRGARGRGGPVRGARDALGPARDAARADRRAPARLARPARQPERACSARSCSGSTGSRTSSSPRATTRPGPPSCRRRPRPTGRGRRASASSPRSTPPTTACSPRPARSTSATSSCRRSGCCGPSRTSARGSLPASTTCWSTSSRTRASPRACCCGCWSPSTATSPSPPTTTSRSTASAGRRRRASPTSAPSGRTPSSRA